jgi:SSS family solute:Na+ symporter
MTSARRTPLIAAVPKMFFPFLVILPGLIAIALPTVTAPADGKGGIGVAAPAGQGIIPAKVKDDGSVLLDKDGKPVLNYDLAIPNMLLHYFPTGMLGLGLTALLASFMSGMAGNITAFNTVWTYDIYKAYVNPTASDRHYLWMGQFATFFGTVISIATAYMATRFNNIMDMLQLVFAFVNAPLFATFLLGMFWKRATGHGAFSGLLSGTAAAAIHHGLTLPAGAEAGIKGGWLGLVHTYPSEMAQNFWAAIFAWTTCFVVTIAVSLFTRPRDDKELVGLVYALTDKPHEGHLTWYQRPLALGLIVLLMTLALNFLFY